FAAFALADIVLIKAIGLGMALAVAIDATLVRALVVPATMRLLGDLNWWAPGPLARLQRRIGLSESTALHPSPIVRHRRIVDRSTGTSGAIWPRVAAYHH